jgi:nicotinamide-nucleotide adenylyltransferase
LDAGLLVGRFQPFHIGHLTAVRYALEQVKLLHIIVGSAEKSHQPNNPFTSGERIKMIKAALDGAGIDCCRWLIIPVPDLRIHSLWIAYVDSLVPKYDVVFSNDALTNRLFQEKGVKTVRVVYHRRKVYSATEVRRRIAEGKKWDDLVPIQVAKIIREINGVQRIRALKHISKQGTE